MGEKITIAAYALIKHQKRGDLAVVANQVTGVLGKITPQEIALIDEVKARSQDLKEYNGHYWSRAVGDGLIDLSVGLVSAAVTGSGACNTM